MTEEPELRTIKADLTELILFLRYNKVRPTQNKFIWHSKVDIAKRLKVPLRVINDVLSSNEGAIRCQLSKRTNQRKRVP